MNLAVLESLEWVDPLLRMENPQSYGEVLATISRKLEIQAVNRCTIDSDVNRALLKVSPKLLELLMTCYNNQNFTPIRNLGTYRFSTLTVILILSFQSS